MTAAEHQTDSRTPAPGGTAKLAGRTVARVGFGVMQLGRRPRDSSLAILRQAISAGVNHLDTAHFYGPCNAYIHDALAPYPADLVLVSKVGADHDPDGTPVPAQRPEQLRAQVDANLAALGVEQVDVVNLRRLDTQPGLIAEGDQLVAMDDQLAELTALRDAGKIGAIGLSNVSAAQLRQALPAGIACVQNNYSVLDRAAEPVLDTCREHGIAWIPFFPLGSAGWGTFRNVTSNPTVTAIASELAITPAQVALAWLLAHYDDTLLIPGTATPAHLTENIAAGSIHLPAAAQATLDHLSERNLRQGNGVAALRTAVRPLSSLTPLQSPLRRPGCVTALAVLAL
jgi:pyridoxine 4-dehydrogenase